MAYQDWWFSNYDGLADAYNRQLEQQHAQERTFLITVLYDGLKALDRLFVAILFVTWRPQPNLNLRSQPRWKRNRWRAKS